MKILEVLALTDHTNIKKNRKKRHITIISILRRFHNLTCFKNSCSIKETNIKHHRKLSKDHRPTAQNRM